MPTSICLKPFLGCYKTRPELRAKIAENNKRTKAEQDEFQAWQARKRQEEETIAEAVSYFVSENPITTSTIVKGKGDADVR